MVPDLDEFIKLTPKQFTQLALVLSAIGAIFSLVSIFSIFNVLGLRILPWQICATIAILSILIATYFLQRAGSKVGL